MTRTTSRQGHKSKWKTRDKQHRADVKMRSAANRVKRGMRAVFDTMAWR